MQSVWKLRMAFLRGVDSLCTTCLFYNCVNYRDQPDTSSLVMMSISLITLMMRLTPSVLRQLSARLWRQRVQFNSIQFKMVYMRSENPYALHPVSQKFPQLCLWNGSNVRLIDDVPLLPFQRRSSSASSFNASLLQAIDGVMSLALYPQVVKKRSHQRTDSH